MNNQERLQRLINDYHTCLDYKDHDTAQQILQEIEFLGGLDNVQSQAN